MQRSHGEVQGSESRHYELIRAAAIWLIDVVQRAALKVRNLQKSHTKKPTKPTEWTIRRPSVGQKIGNNMPCTRRKARGSDAIGAPALQACRDRKSTRLNSSHG